MRETATDWHDGQITLMRHALLRHTALVIPGRRQRVRANARPDDRLRVEPGIHFTTEHAAGWIPGSRLRRAPE